MSGPAVAGELATFADNFATPERGRYVFEPARFDERGVAWLPPAPPDPFLPRTAAVVGMALLAGTAAVAWRAAARRGGQRA
jgi:hypothetical protein